MTRASEHVNQLPPAQRIRVTLDTADTMSALVASTAKSLKRTLTMFPYEVPGARRAIRTLAVTPKMAIYEVYYLSTTAWDRTH